MTESSERLLRKTKTAGIMNLVGAVLCFLYLAAFLVCLYGGLLIGEGGGSEEGAGAAIAAVVLLPLLLICFVPICVTEIVWQTVFCVKLFRICAEAQRGENRRFSKAPYAASLVLKILSIPLLAVSMLFLYAFGSLGLTWAFTIFTILLAAYFIVTLAAENKSKRERLEKL